MIGDFDIGPVIVNKRDVVAKDDHVIEEDVEAVLEEVLLVEETHAVSKPIAVVIKLHATSITHLTMSRTRWF